MKNLAAILVTLLLLGEGCTDLGTPVPAPASPPPPPPNFDNMSFAADVQPILLGNCAVPGCHSGSAPASGFDQSTYSSLRAGGVKYGANVIIAGDSTNSGIIKALRGTGLVARMPQGGVYAATGLPNTMIVKIGAWIQQGALNN